MSNISEKLITIAENTPKVYYSGKMNVVKSSDYLKGSESGSSILVEDVSPVEHTMSVKVRGKNLWCDDYDKYTHNVYNVHPISLPKGDYYISINKYGNETVTDVTIGIAKSGDDYPFNNSLIVLFTSSGVEIPQKITVGGEKWTSPKLAIFATKTNWEKFFANYHLQLELGTTATAYTPYVPDLTSVKVSRYGKNLFNKNKAFDDSTKVSAEEGATFSYTYFIQLQPNTTYYCTVFNPQTSYGIMLLSSRPDVNASTSTALAISHLSAQGGFDTWGTQKALTTGQSGKLYIGSFIGPDKISECIQLCNLQIQLGNVGTEYEEYIPQTGYTPNADGTVDNVTSIYPSTTLISDTSGALIDCEYYKDIDTAYNELTTSIALSGGE